MDWSGPERLQMNMGPQHPSAHGVFRAIVTLEGETVVAVDAVIGYLHRCHEKLSETLTYAQYPSIASKTDYVAAMTSEFAYVMAAEEIGKFEVPKRAQYLRVIVAELQRIASHLLWLGTWCMDMGGALGGGATIFLYCIRERELVLDLFESLVGARLLYGFHQVGGVRYDLPEGWIAQCKATIDLIEQRIGEYESMLGDNPFFTMRTRGVGVVSTALAQVKVPKGEAYARVEGPRGEVGCYLVADGTNKPYRMKWRGASFSNLAILPHILPGSSVADVVAIMGSVDPVFGEVDR